MNVTRRRIEWTGVSVMLSMLLGCNSAPQPSEPAASTAPPAPAPAKAVLTAGWTVTDKIDAPESVFVDHDAGFIYASQVTGMPDGRDGTGRIIKLNFDGTVVSSDWVTGLNAPKGLRACQGTLWTADLDEIIGIEVATGSISSRLKIFGAKFLNDVACAPDGSVYVSDMLASRIYVIKNGEASIFADGESLEYPNGLLVEGDVLVVGGWGKPEADFSTKVPGHLYTLNLATKAKTLITPKPFANIDGLESDGHEGYVVSDWVAGKIYRVSKTGDARVVREFKPGTADIAFVPAGNILIVPHMNENRVAAYDVTDAMN